MVYEGIKLDTPAGKVSMSHSHSLDMIRGQSSDQNVEWLDNLGEVPWGIVKGAHPERFEHASKIISLCNMDYQTCNGGIGQYFFNHYHEAREPFHTDDVTRVDLDAQKAFFSDVVNFAKSVYPDRAAENAALEKACDAFQELWYEEDAEGVETIYCDEDETIWDEDLEEEVPNPDYFEPYDEIIREDVIHNDNGFDDIFYAANDYLEELLELQAQLCSKKLILEVTRDPAKQSEIQDALKSVFPASAFAKPSLSDQIQSASDRQSSSRSDNQQPVKMMPMPGTTSPDWGEKHWGEER